MGVTGSNIVAPLRHAGAASVSAPLAGVSSRVVDAEAMVLGKSGGGNEG